MKLATGLYDLRFESKSIKFYVREDLIEGCHWGAITDIEDNIILEMAAVPIKGEAIIDVKYDRRNGTNR